MDQIPISPTIVPDESNVINLNPNNLKPTDVGISESVMYALMWLLKPSNVILVAGKKRTGKTHLLTWLTWYSVMFENAEVLTNMVFKQRQPDGKFKLGYPPGVTFCNSLLDIMIHTARVITEGNKKVIVVMDEIQNFIAAYDWNSPLAKDFVIFLGIISKLKQTYILATPDYKMFPRGIRDPDADVATVLLYKDIAHTHDFNRECGTDYKTKELVFVERPGCEKEAWEIDICPWARSEETVEVGEFVYDHLVPGSRFSLGTIGGYTFDFRDIIETLEHCIAEEIPERLVAWVKQINGYKRYLEFQRRRLANDSAPPEASNAAVQPTQSAPVQNPPKIEITKTMTPEQCLQIEDEVVFPYLTMKTSIVPAEMVGKGLAYSDASLYHKWSKLYERWEKDPKNFQKRLKSKKKHGEK